MLFRDDEEELEELHFVEDAEEEPELCLYSTHLAQRARAKPAPPRVRCVDISSSPRRVSYPTLEELKGLLGSGLWEMVTNGDQDGELTVVVRGKKVDEWKGAKG